MWIERNGWINYGHKNVIDYLTGSHSDAAVFSFPIGWLSLSVGASSLPAFHICVSRLPRLTADRSPNSSFFTRIKRASEFSAVFNPIQVLFESRINGVEYECPAVVPDYGAKVKSPVS